MFSFDALRTARPFLRAAMVEKAGRFRRRGPMLVNPDPTHSEAAPGEKQNVPFQIPDALSRLHDAYDVQIEYGDSGGGASLVWSRASDQKPLVDRRASSSGGQLESDVIDRMRFEGLPSAQGAPLSLELQLIEQRAWPRVLRSSLTSRRIAKSISPGQSPRNHAMKIIVASLEPRSLVVGSRSWPWPSARRHSADQGTDSQAEYERHHQG